MEGDGLMIVELALGELTGLAVRAMETVVSRSKSGHDWKKLFVDTGKIFVEYEKNADQIFDDLAKALSSQNMKELAEKLKAENGYELKQKVFDYILRLLHSYEIPEDIALSYATGVTNAILEEIKVVAPDKYERYFLNDWREEDKLYLESISSKIQKIEALLAAFERKEIHVYSANEKDMELKRKTFYPRIGIDFFEIDDEKFQAVFAEQLPNHKICVRGRFVEETIYCVLNEIWRLRDPRPVFVVQDAEDWERLSRISQRDNIYIPNFIADEIAPIENNTNIFIFTKDIPAFSNEIIDLRPRTYATLSKCLVRAGLDSSQADRLVEETHGLYVAMKKKLFGGQLLKQPEWLSKLEGAIQKTCLLLGQWTECEGDQVVVEALSGMAYPKFVEKLLPYSKGEDPLVHLVNRRGKKTYYLSSVENTWEYLQVSVTEPIWDKFVALFLEVINEHEKIFTYAPRELLQARFGGEELFWSPNIRKGMLKTLLIKAGYKKYEECQGRLDQIVETILTCVDHVDKWKYISEFFMELCEIAPKVVLDRLFKELEESSGLLSLFENQDSDFIMGKNHYIYILFGVSEFLLQREYATDAFAWLLKLDDRGFVYKLNSPADLFKKVLCTWYHFSAFRKPSEKIRLAKLAFEEDRNAWDVIYESLPGDNQTIIGGLQAPLYRTYAEHKAAEQEEIFQTATGYIDILLHHTDFRSDRWIRLLKYSDEIDGEMRSRIFDKFLYEAEQMTDSEKIAVKNSIRGLIYRHRYYSSASWALPEEEVKTYEALLDEVRCTEQEYEYLYLFRPRHEGLLLHPLPYREEERMDFNEAAVADLLSEKIAEFQEKNYNLGLLAELCASTENPSLGRVLAVYWNGGSFDVDVFTALLRAQESAAMALDYYAGFGAQTTELFDEVMAAAQAFGSDSGVIADIYRVQARYCKGIPRIAEATEDIKRIFWKYEWVSVGQDKKWALKESKKYGTLNSYLYLLYFANDEHRIPEEELYGYLDGIEKMECNPKGEDFRYYLQELLKPLQNAYLEDSVRCVRIATIEMIFFHFLPWGDMKCFKQSIRKDPKVYADLVSLVFRKDHGHTLPLSDEEREYRNNLHSLYIKARFCPAEVNGEVKAEELESWIHQFKGLLEENDQGSLFGALLGRLFAFSPKGLDGHKPCEAVRPMIEKYFDGRLGQGYRSAVLNQRGMFSPTAGKAELELAESFKANAEYLTFLGYPRTAKIYYELARDYYDESADERQEAENAMF